MNTELSHVGMGFSLCPVCCIEHDETVILDKRLKPTLKPRQCTGWALCPEHEAMKQEYVALVECRNEPTSLDDAERTGVIAHVRRSAWQNLFNTPPPPGPIAFIERGAIDRLKARMP